MWLQSQLHEFKSISCFPFQSNAISAFQIQEASTIPVRTRDRHEIQMFAYLQCLFVFYGLEQEYGWHCATADSVMS